MEHRCGLSLNQSRVNERLLSTVDLCPALNVWQNSRTMELTYELTQKDFYHSFLAHRGRSAISKWTFRLLVGLIFLLPAFGLVALATGHESKLANVIPLFALAAFWAVFIWGSPWWVARNQFLQQPAAKGSRKMTLDDSGVHWRWEGGQADVQWTNFIRFLESKTVFLLYTSPACFNIVPKRALAPNETESLRGLLKEKLGPTMAANDKRISPRLVVFLTVVGVALILLVMAIRNILGSAH